jgi:hypothetical protein
MLMTISLETSMKKLVKPTAQTLRGRSFIEGREVLLDVDSFMFSPLYL